MRSSLGDALNAERAPGRDQQCSCAPGSRFPNCLTHVASLFHKLRFCWHFVRSDRQRDRCRAVTGRALWSRPRIWQFFSRRIELITAGDTPSGDRLQPTPSHRRLNAAQTLDDRLHGVLHPVVGAELEQQRRQLPRIRPARSVDGFPKETDGPPHVRNGSQAVKLRVSIFSPNYPR